MIQARGLKGPFPIQVGESLPRRLEEMQRYTAEDFLNTPLHVLRQLLTQFQVYNSEQLRLLQNQLERQIQIKQMLDIKVGVICKMKSDQIKEMVGLYEKTNEQVKEIRLTDMIKFLKDTHSTMLKFQFLESRKQKKAQIKREKSLFANFLDWLSPSQNYSEEQKDQGWFNSEEQQSLLQNSSARKGRKKE